MAKADPQDVSDLCQGMVNLSIIDVNKDEEASLYDPDADTADSSASTSTERADRDHGLTARRHHLNAFLQSCNVSSRVGQYRKAWDGASTRTQRSHVTKAKDVVVSALKVITPGDEAHLWHALQSSKLVEKDLGCDEPSLAENKYLQALAETYRNASSWDTRRQVLSVMADIVPLKLLQRYLSEIN